MQGWWLATACDYTESPSQKSRYLVCEKRKERRENPTTKRYYEMTRRNHDMNTTAIQGSNATRGLPKSTQTH